jgi:hypothetical protein
MRNGICLDCAAALHVDEHTGELVDQWGEPICGGVLPITPAGRAVSPEQSYPNEKNDRSERNCKRRGSPHRTRRTDFP